MSALTKALRDICEPVINAPVQAPQHAAWPDSPDSVAHQLGAKAMARTVLDASDAHAEASTPDFRQANPKPIAMNCWCGTTAGALCEDCMSPICHKHTVEADREVRTIPQPVALRAMVRVVCTPACPDRRLPL